MQYFNKFKQIHFLLPLAKQSFHPRTSHIFCIIENYDCMESNLLKTEPEKTINYYNVEVIPIHNRPNLGPTIFYD